MTRDEAFNKLVNASDEWNQEQQQILNEIYDDFESRVCGNCKYYDVINDENGFCDGDTIGMVGICNKKDFCSYFERKTHIDT